MDLRLEQDAAGAWLIWPGGRQACAIGRGGVRADKREGDGATPVGAFALKQVLYRPDRLAAPPVTGLPVRALAPLDGWCDDPAHPAYNRPVMLPFSAGHERLWRDDGLYDVIVVLGHNDDPPVPGRGSAIFLHATKPGEGPHGFKPTLGCVAVPLPRLLALLERNSPGDRLIIPEL